MRFVLFKGQSQYGSLRLHIDQLASALNAQGHQVAIVDLTQPEGMDLLKATFHAPPDCYLGMGGVGVDLKTGAGESIYDLLNATFVQVHVDHPIHHAGRLTVPVKRNVAFFLDRSHVQFVNAWTAAKPSHAAFLPPGANELAEPVDVSDEAFARRDIPILFTGTYRGQPATPWRDLPEGALRNVLENVALQMAGDATLPILDALKATMTLIGGDLSPQLLSQFAPLLNGPQFFAEAYHRNALLETLGKNGVPVRVYGVGWRPLVDRFPSFDYGGVGSFEETLQLLRRAKIVLNTNNGFVSGGHERVFAAMCGGAAVVSDETSYYAEAFQPDREIALFSWKKLGDLPARLGALLSDQPRLAAMARAGHARARADHTWAARAQVLVNTVQQAA